MESPKPENTEVSAPHSGPGRLLQQARQDLRLAPEDVAQILHLSSKQIVALEKDDYQSLPGPTYVRGYLRGYAQLLGLSPEKVVEAYNSLTPATKPIAPPQSAPPPQVTSSDRVVKVATLGVAALLLGMVYLWWQSDNESSEEPAVPMVADKPANEGLPPAVVAEDAVPAGKPANGAGAETATATPKPAASAPVAAPNGQLTVSGMTLNVAPAEAPKPASAAPAEPVVTRARRAVDIPPDVPRARMVLHAVEESWADVRDARDNRLLYENVPAGRRISIEGVAPFSVFVGNADGVRVEFNGRNYDISRHKRGQVARFTLGDETAVNN